MSNEDRIKALFSATAEQLAAIDGVLSGKAESEGPSLRSLRMIEAARKSGISRTTLWRAINEGRLRAVEIRKGSRRIPEAELRRFVEGGTE